MSRQKGYGCLKSIQIKKHLCAPLFAQVCYFACFAFRDLNISERRIKLPLTFRKRFLRLHDLCIESNYVLVYVE